MCQPHAGAQIRRLISQRIIIESSGGVEIILLKRGFRQLAEVLAPQLLCRLPLTHCRLIRLRSQGYQLLGNSDRCLPVPLRLIDIQQMPLRCDAEISGLSRKVH